MLYDCFVVVVLASQSNAPWLLRGRLPCLRILAVSPSTGTKVTSPGAAMTSKWGAAIRLRCHWQDICERAVADSILVPLGLIQCSSNRRVCTQHRYQGNVVRRSHHIQVKAQPSNASGISRHCECAAISSSIAPLDLLQVSIQSPWNVGSQRGSSGSYVEGLSHCTVTQKKA